LRAKRSDRGDAFHGRWVYNSSDPPRGSARPDDVAPRTGETPVSVDADRYLLIGLIALQVGLID
jgi:hypothetical protein